MATRAEMRLRTRQSLVDAAVKLFGRRDYASTSLDEIVAEIGVTKGAFYHYFSGKEDLFLFIQGTALDDVIRRCAVAVAEAADATAELSKLIEVQIDVLVKYRGSLGYVRPEHDRRASPQWVEIRAKRDRVERFFIDAISRGRQSGEFGVEGETRLLANGILGMCYWTHTWYRADGRWKVQDLSAHFTRLALAGLAGPLND